MNDKIGSKMNYNDQQKADPSSQPCTNLDLLCFTWQRERNHFVFKFNSHMILRKKLIFALFRVRMRGLDFERFVNKYVCQGICDKSAENLELKSIKRRR